MPADAVPTYEMACREAMIINNIFPHGDSLLWCNFYPDVLCSGPDTAAVGPGKKIWCGPPPQEAQTGGAQRSKVWLGIYFFTLTTYFRPIESKSVVKTIPSHLEVMFFFLATSITTP